jgi:hypothetical protein
MMWVLANEFEEDLLEVLLASNPPIHLQLPQASPQLEFPNQQPHISIIFHAFLINLDSQSSSNRKQSLKLLATTLRNDLKLNLTLTRLDRCEQTERKLNQTNCHNRNRDDKLQFPPPPTDLSASYDYVSPL